MFSCRSSHRKVSCKKGALFCQISPYCGQWLIFSRRKGYFYRRLLFSQVILPELRAGSFSHELKCSSARKKIQNSCSSHNVELFKGKPRFTRLFTSIYFSVSSLRIKKNAIIFSGSIKYRKNT